MKIIKYKAVILFLAFFAFSCNDDFMERFPKTSIAPQNFFNNETDLQMYIYSLYDFGSWTMCYHDSESTTDNGVTTGSSEIKNIMLSNPSSSTITTGWTWGQLRRVNFFLAYFKNASVSQEALDHYEGLARFFRARFYYDKVLRYNDVPWEEDELQTNSDVLWAKQDTRDFVVRKIMEDFEFAARHVRTNQLAGAVDKWVVMTFYARYALYEASYRKYHTYLNLESSANEFFELAARVSKDIIDNGGFAIHNTGNPDTDYASLFRSQDLTRNREVIMPVIYDYLQRSNGNSGTMFGNYETSPTKDMVQTYLMKTGAFYSSQPGYQTKSFVEEFENRDPRMYQTLAYPGWVLVNTSTFAQGAGLYVTQLAKSFTGYHQIKGFHNESTQASINGAEDWPLLRYAEVLLTYAEAKAELGTITEQDLHISVNQLRARAGMPDMPFSPPVDPQQVAKYSYTVSPLLLEIRRERRVELAYEGYRFWDMMRYKMGKLLEEPAKGLYFPGLGKYDVTGNGIEDIVLISRTDPIPNPRETNELGVELIYYRVGTIGEDGVDVYLENGESGNIDVIASMGTFVEPKYYYRPVPVTQTTLNPNLFQQFGWE